MPGKERAVRIEIAMSNSAGIFQVDELLATKLRGSGLEEHVEVVARIDAEHEKRLVPVFRIWRRHQCTPRIRCARATCSVDACSVGSTSPFAAAESGKTLYAMCRIWSTAFGSSA